MMNLKEKKIVPETNKKKKSVYFGFEYLLVIVVYSF